MKVTLFGRASVIALAIGAAGIAGPALAQQPQVASPPLPEEGSTVEAVVLTGSLIRGTPLDAVLPVEVHTRVELEEQGSPTALEFAKTLTISGPTTGEAYYFGGVAPGVVSFNLRGIGADKTLTLLNGRRNSENTSNIPSLATERIEVLKDGAAVTYGADAIGGVVNFITRRRFVGLEANAQYKFIDGSDGDYGFGIIGGIGEDDVNLYIAVEHEHRSRLNSMERDFVRESLDFTDGGYNRAPWSTLTNLAGWLPRGSLPAVPADNVRFPSTTQAGQWGNPVAGVLSDFTRDSCEAVGGRFDNSFTCAYNYIPYYNLVEENDIWRVYTQLSARVTENIQFRGDISYAKVDSPQIFGSPAQPVIRGPALSGGATYQFYVPIANPHAQAFATRVGAPGSTQGFTPVTYRIFAHGGNPYFGEGNGFGVPSRFSSQVFRVSTALEGELGDMSFLRDVRWDAAVTYNQSEVYADSPDVIGYRLQEALSGFGGPNCSVPDLDPARFGTQNAALAGTGDCSWWNPFATGFAEQPVLGLENPQHVPGTENSEELTRWLFDDRATTTHASNMNFDLVFSGGSALTLPGGEVGWALGVQARSLEEYERVPSDIYNGTLECFYPTTFTGANGVGSQNIPQNPYPPTAPEHRGCNAEGPFTFFGTNPPDSAKLNQQSFFGELQLPVFDTMDLQLAVRHEEFSNDLSATVYKVSGRWNVWGPLTLRGGYGTNYQTPPLGITPGEVNNVVRSYTIAASNWLGAQLVTRQDLEPETATTWNIGAIWNGQGLQEHHAFRVILDYFDIETEDEIGEIASPADIAALVYNGANGTITTCDPAVQPLLDRITFNAGCTVGMGAVGTFASVRTDVGNGPGQHTSGFDLQTTYMIPLGEHDLTLGLNATYVTRLRTGPTELDGVVISAGDDRLGNLNYATVAFAAPKVRANFSANYAMPRHNFRLGVNYVSRVQDERPNTGLAGGDRVQYGEYGKQYVTVDLTHRYEVTDSLVLTSTVANIFNEDPPPAEEELGYDPRLGSPLGRTFEVGLKKTF